MKCSKQDLPPPETIAKTVTHKTFKRKRGRPQTVNADQGVTDTTETTATSYKQWQQGHGDNLMVAAKKKKKLQALLACEYFVYR